MYWEVIDPLNQDDDGRPSVVTERAEVPGGWLVRIIHHDWKGDVFQVGGLTFVPDPNQEWKPLISG